MAFPLEINSQFKYALDLLQDETRSLFITGKAGTGKSTLLEYFAQNCSKELVLLAPTGVAALNVKGQTIHSFFNFYIDVTPEKIRNREMRPRNPRLYKAIRTIIIDEVSMVRADILDCIDTFLRMYGPHTDRPFGGVQMVFVGDLYQLPPVVNAQERSIFSNLYESPYFFSAKVFEGFSVEIIELEKIYRQKDQDFVDLLNRIRNNSVKTLDIDHLNSRLMPEFEAKTNEFYINLTTTNQKADEINDKYLSKLLGKMHSFEASISGEFNKEYFPTAPILKFKAGSQVMMLNNDSKRRWVNGTIGIVESVKKIDQEDVVNIRLQEDKTIISVQPFKWEVFKFFVENDKIKTEAVGTFSQFPFRLAWAVTIHKSQGKTFERVIIDIGKGAFAAGQVYVGLSRCTSFEGVVLKAPIMKHHIRSDPRIYKFMTGYQYRKAHEALSAQERVRIIKEAIGAGEMLEMTYLKANDTKSLRTIKPLTVGVATYGQKLFPALRAFCFERQEERTFHVGRILQLVPVYTTKKAKS